MTTFETTFSTEVQNLITQFVFGNVKFKFTHGTELSVQDLIANAKVSQLGKDSIRNQISNLTTYKKKLEGETNVDPFSKKDSTNQNEKLIKLIKDIDDKIKVLYAVASMIVEEEEFKTSLEKSKKEKDQKLAELKAKKEMIEVNKLNKLDVDALQKEIDNIDNLVKELENN